MIHFNTDAESLHEEDYEEDPLYGIITRNDVVALNKYAEENPEQFLTPSELTEDDPFYIAAEDTRLDALRVLLDLSDSGQIQPPANVWGFSLLDIACLGAQFDTVRFLLDRDPPLGTMYAMDCHGGRALLSAARSLRDIYPLNDVQSPESHRKWAQDRIACAENMICLLLDRGASVRDAIILYPFTGDQKDQKQSQLSIIETILGDAVCRVSYNLVSRLIAEGADVHARQAGDGPCDKRAEQATALHIGSCHWNLQGIKALLDNHGSKVDVAEMVSARDSNGCLPLHWAAAGPTWDDEHLFTEDEIASLILDVFGLLIESNPSIINVQDQYGATPLHYTVRSHAGCGRHYQKAIQFLCDRGADASIRDKTGQNVLHILAYRSAGADPVNPVILDILIAHGAKINDPDIDGNTPLHLMARNLRQLNLARVLLYYGANINAINNKGETPLHKAMQSVLLAYSRNDGTIIRSTLEMRFEAHDEMLKILQEAGGSMDQPNSEGKTPRQLLKETREAWREAEEARHRTLDERKRGCETQL